MIKSANRKRSKYFTKYNFVNQWTWQRTVKIVTSLISSSHRDKEVNELITTAQYINIYTYSPIKLFWFNSMNRMMCNCWILRNTKSVEYWKWIFAFRIRTQSHVMWLLKMTQRNNSTWKLYSTSKLISALNCKLN